MRMNMKQLTRMIVATGLALLLTAVALAGSVAFESKDYAAARGYWQRALALLPAESVSDSGIFVDDVTLASLEATAPMPVALSYHFTDALAGAGVR